VPLQPLINDLDNNVYAVFEQDPIKYQQYEKAITKALIDRAKNNINKVITICVVGAGRGPLVNASLKASDSSKVPVKVYAVEKNKNALYVLNYNNENYWHNLVTVVGADMRTWQFEEKCDILVSELLGSLGDNELSPECLDGAQKFLKDDGICIPSSYTSYVSPLQSQTLFSNMKLFKNTTIMDNSHENAEQIYVVNMRNMYIIAPAQPLFTFNHPRCDLRKNNDRYTTLTFDIKQDCVLHGFAGYFNAVLYKDINISIEPLTFSTGMFSWYPAYIPIKSSMILKKDEQLKLHFWRLSNTSKVWYEWSISEPSAIPVHNPNARSYSMQLH
jgi:protein arginine N-methyltransferase 5